VFTTLLLPPFPGKKEGLYGFDTSTVCGTTIGLRNRSQAVSNTPINYQKLECGLKK